MIASYISGLSSVSSNKRGTAGGILNSFRNLGSSFGIAVLGAIFVNTQLKIFSSDLNPVAVLLNKVVAEYLPKYGEKLKTEIERWGTWINKKEEHEIGQYYPSDNNGAIPIAYFISSKWLQSYAYRINLGIEIFVFSIFIVFFIALATMSYSSIKSALSNPVKSLRYE